MLLRVVKSVDPHQVNGNFAPSPRNTRMYEVRDINSQARVKLGPEFAQNTEIVNSTCLFDASNSNAYYSFTLGPPYSFSHSPLD